jgi:transcriptional regulator with XRE-family HTH domain
VNTRLTPEQRAERDEWIRRLREAGFTLAEIAGKVGLSQQMVWLILNPEARERSRATSLQWAAEHREEAAAKSRQWHLDNAEYHRAASKAWYRRPGNRERKQAAQNARRRAKRNEGELL